MRDAIAPAILALCLGHVFSNAVRTLPAVAVDVLTRDLGISAEMLAQVTGAFPLAFAAVMIPVGVALDRHGAWRVSQALLLAGLAGSLLGAAAQGPWTMLAAQVVLGAGCSGMLMAPITFAARRLSAARFALWSGLIQAVGNTGMLLSASPLALLIEHAGWRAGYLACATIPVLAIAAIRRLVPRDVPEVAPAQSARADAREVVGMLASPRLRGIVVFVFASFAAVLGLRGLWGGPWLMEVKGLDRLAAGNVLLACTVALTAGPALAGAVLRRFGRPVLWLTGSHLLCAGVILALVLGRAAPVWFDATLFVLFGLLISFQVIGFSLVRAAVPPEKAGRALSAANLSFFLGAAVLQGLSGLSAAWGGIGAALLTFSLALVACTLGFLALQRRV